MNKTEIINAVALRAEMTKKDAETAVNAFIETVKEALKKEEKIQLVGFGTFEVRKRKARKGRNPQNGDIIDIAEAKIPAFRAGKALRISAKDE